jgi:hypothetical protein
VSLPVKSGVNPGSSAAVTTKVESNVNAMMSDGFMVFRSLN